MSLATTLPSFVFIGLVKLEIVFFIGHEATYIYETKEPCDIVHGGPIP